MAITLASARLLTLRHTGEPEAESNSWYDSASAQPYAIIDNAINQAEQDIGQELMMRGCEDALAIFGSVTYTANETSMTWANLDVSGALPGSKILRLFDGTTSIHAYIDLVPLTRMDKYDPSAYVSFPHRRILGTNLSSSVAMLIKGSLNISPAFSQNATLMIYYVPAFGRMNGIASVTMTNYGSSYETTPTVTFTDAGGTGAAGTAVMETGAVASVTITAPGTNYGVDGATTVTFTGGGGADAAGTVVTGVNSVLPDEARYALSQRAAVILMSENGRDDSQVRGLFMESMSQLVNALQTDRAGRFSRCRPRYQGIIP